MSTTHVSYEVIELNMPIVVFDKYGLLNTVVIVREVPIQKAAKDAKKCPTQNTCCFQTKHAPSQLKSDAFKGNHEKEVKEYIVSLLLHRFKGRKGCSRYCPDTSMVWKRKQWNHQHNSLNI